MEKVENLFKLNVDHSPPSAASSSSPLPSPSPSSSSSASASFSSSPSGNDDEEMTHLACVKSEHNFDDNNSFLASSSTNIFNVKNEEELGHQEINDTNVNVLNNDDDNNDNDNDTKNYISQMDINLLLSNNRNDSLPDSINDLKQLEQDKKAVYSHPLFPLLALLFEKCETATRSINVFETETNLTSSFNNEIEEFIKHQKALGKPLFTDDSEVNSLMIKAIQVFRIHLLELEKVSDLCKDFCYRYISCLKTKMRSESLIRGNHGDGSNPDQTNKLFNNFKNDLFFSGDQSFFCSTSSSSNLSSNSSPVSYLSNSPEPSPSFYLAQKSQQLFNNNNNNNSVPFEMESMSRSKSSSPLSNQPLSVNFDTLFTPLFKSMTKSNSHSKLNISNDHYSNNINFINNDNEDDNSVVHDLSLKNRSTINNELNLFDNNNTSDKKKRKAQFDNINGNTSKNSPKMIKSSKDSKKAYVDITKTSGVNHSKRGVLPKQATTIMRTWLFQHIVHPYPTEDEKRAIASETNLTLLQVNNWFINARRRILQPMLDSAQNMQAELLNNSTNLEQELDLSVSKVKNVANVSGSKAHTKKLRLNQQMNRFWPQSLANIIQTNDGSSQSKF